MGWVTLTLTLTLALTLCGEPLDTGEEPSVGCDGAGAGRVRGARHPAQPGALRVGHAPRGGGAGGTGALAHLPGPHRLLPRGRRRRVGRAAAHPCVLAWVRVRVRARVRVRVRVRVGVRVRAKVRVAFVYPNPNLNLSPSPNPNHVH